MKKFAVFVEGFTEQEFVIRLLRKLAGEKQLRFEIYDQHRGYLQLRSFIQHPEEIPEWNVLIANCNNDEQVKTQIIDNYGRLVSQGYQYIIGVKDVYPLKLGDLSRLRTGISIGLPVGLAPVEIHLAVMEVEAWFIEEYTHFTRIHPALNDEIIRSVGFDRISMTAEQIENPATILHQIYQKVGLAYKKTGRHISRTVDALDFEIISNSARSRSASLDGFLQSIEKAIS